MLVNFVAVGIREVRIQKANVQLQRSACFISIFRFLNHASASVDFVPLAHSTLKISEGKMREITKTGAAGLLAHVLAVLAMITIAGLIFYTR
jgi:hypothetical protein